MDSCSMAFAALLICTVSEAAGCDAAWDDGGCAVAAWVAGCAGATLLTELIIWKGPLFAPIGVGRDPFTLRMLSEAPTHSLGTCARGLGVAEDDFQHQQACADDDRAIGEIEDRPLILLQVEEQEIHNAAAGHAVP